MKRLLRSARTGADGPGGADERSSHVRHSLLSGDQYPDGTRIWASFRVVRTAIGWKRPSVAWDG